jgi:hypothetical protein
MIELPKDRMPEAEVSLRMALGLIASGAIVETIDVAIDGAQIRTLETTHFPIAEFLASLGWSQVDGGNGWRGMYLHPDFTLGFRVHSKSGKGDVVARLRDGRTLRVESKKGTLERSRSSAEYPLIREGLGQLLTVDEAGASDVLAIAVPSSEKFEALTAVWRSRPLIVRAGIHLVTVDRQNTIRGLEVAGV